MSVSATSDRACSAASIISESSRTSRCIEQACFGQHLLAQPLVKRVPRDEIDVPAEDHRQLVGEILDVPAQACTRLQLEKEIDIALRSRLAAAGRAENLQPRNPVPPADLSNVFVVNGEARYVHHAHRRARSPAVAIRDRVG